jgi:hypothetical protein
MHCSAFAYLREKFPSVSAEKTKAGVLIGPQIRQLFKDDHFECVFSDIEKRAGNPVKMFRLAFGKC